MTSGEIDTEWVEGQAYDLLNRVPEFIWDGETLPVPVDDIVDSVLGLRVRTVDDMSMAPGCEDLQPGEVSGLLLTGLGEIWVDANEAGQWDTRRRFTVGHEVGHYLIHNDGRPQIFCRQADIVEDGEPRNGPTPKPVPELEADAFAAALLMPAHLVREQAEACGRDLETMKERFNCSHKAMKYRLLMIR
jgi:hypothetical protein